MKHLYRNCWFFTGAQCTVQHISIRISVNFIILKCNNIYRTYLHGRKTVIRMLGKSFCNILGLKTFVRTEYQVKVFVLFVELIFNIGKQIGQCIHLFLPFLAVVVFSFFICWSPFHSQRLMFVFVTLYGKWTKPLLRAQHVLFMISGINKESLSDY